MNIQPHGELVNAFCTGFSGPECPYWNAREDAAENCPESVYDYDSHKTPTRELKSFRGEDSLVL
jgi:hypothetical protein